MPYATMDEVNPAIKGIDPPVTLAQANLIAEWADEIEDVESPWAVAIANFQKAYRVEGGKWVKRVAEADVAEALTKSVGGQDLPASSFLVVEDPEEVGTWHLPVKDAQGNADHRRMGAAWASLHGGYRGNVYEGPGKTAAIKKLKALYAAEDMETPEVGETAAEYDEDVEQEAQWNAPLHALTFSAVDAAASAREAMDALRVRMGQFNALMNNIMWSDEVPNKATALRALTNDFIGLLPRSLRATETAPGVAEPQSVAVAESLTGLELVSEGRATADGRGPMVMSIRLIKPGFGNPKQNHYYPAEMLKREARKFVGAKMHEVDHRQKDKSNKTWVSTITDITGFAPDGAPIAEVLVHDPEFAQRARNLEEGGQLERLECSIMADAKAVRGKVNDKKGKIIESFVKTGDVDWVTKAGAGGRALAIAESEAADMADKEEQLREDAAEEVVKIEEGGAEEAGETQEAAKPPCASDVLKALLASDLPRPAQLRVAEGDYQTAEELAAAIEAEGEYVRSLGQQSGGKPKGLTRAKVAEKDEKPLAERERAAMAKYGVGG